MLAFWNAIVFGVIAFQVHAGDAPSADIDYLTQEINFIAPLKERLTGSPTHNALINHIQTQLENLGLKVYTDDLKFTYYNGPLSQPKVSVGDNNVPVTSYSKYSGFTGPDGVGGTLVDVTTSSLDEMPDWKKASGNIALTNITNIPTDYAGALSVWPGSPEWMVQYGNPEGNAEALVHNLTVAANAGVKAVIYAWQNASTGLVNGQWVPFHNIYQGVPTVFVQGDYGNLESLQEAAANGTPASVKLKANMVPNTSARTLWTVIEGTELKNESLIINTHTDGTNIIEENGYIALMAQAKHLVANPPRRTTILLFVGQHMHMEAFAQEPQRATSRWLWEHPEYWTGQGQSHAFEYGGQLKAVAGTCVEHIGAVHWDESIEDDTWYPTDSVEPELLYAATPELNQLLREHWNGADPNVTRVTNAVDSAVRQGGEGYPFFLVNIPNLSLVTNPSYLLKIWPKGFDEAQLVDMQALKRQVDSFLRIWKVMDGMSAEEFGMQNPNGTQKALHI